MSTPVGSTPLVIYGSGGHGKVVADAAGAAGWDVRGFADDNPAKAGAAVLNVPVLAIGFAAGVAYCRRHGAAVVVALGDNRARRRVFSALVDAGITPATIIHPSAVIAPSATIADGTVVFAGAVINPDSHVGENVIINTGVTVDHDNQVHDHAHLAPGVHTGGTVSIGEGALVGVGASVRNNMAIGAWSVVGAGAVVVAAVPAGVVAYGNPARVQCDFDS
jgi:sugar O-acyltransferase (sialic acid O-acetyltransferase NeuD family)